MKQTILTLIALLALTTSVMAQDDKQEHKRPSKEEMIALSTDRMAERYGLDEDQKAKLLNLNTQYADSIRLGGGRGPRGQFGRPGGDHKPGLKPQAERPTREEIQAQQQKQREQYLAYDKELKQILTPEQYNKYREDRKQLVQRGGAIKQGRPRGQRPPRPEAAE